MLISVIIPAFNVANCLGRALDSVLAQTHQDFEILVIDDDSSDATVALIQHYSERNARIRLLKNPENAGPSAARNRGLTEARGEWVALLDADDAYHPERLEALYKVSQKYAADMVFDNLYLYDSGADVVVGSALPDPDQARHCVIDSSAFLQQCITGRSLFDYGQFKAFLRREFLVTHQLIYPQTLRHGEDFVLYANMLLAGARLVLVSKPYYYFTQRIGMRSAKPSAFSRTVINLDGMRNHTLALLDHPAVTQNAQLADLIQQRAAAIPWHQSRVRMHPFMQHRDLFGLIALSLRDWRIPVLMLQKLWGRVHVRGQRMKIP